MSTYAKIATQTLSSSQATVSFTAIPQNYTDLVIHIFGRSAFANAVEAVYMRFNSTTTNYSNNTIIYGESTGKGCFKPSIQYIHAGYLTGGNQPANYVGKDEIYILSYSATDMEKTVLSRATTESSNTTSQSGVQTAQYGFWNNVAAVTQIDFTTESGGNFASGSIFDVYGILKA